MSIFFSLSLELLFLADCYCPLIVIFRTPQVYLLLQAVITFAKTLCSVLCTVNDFHGVSDV